MSGDCNIDINCPEAADWQVIKRAVCRIYIGTRGEFCTGTLINDAASDGNPYLLTANHCVKYLRIPRVRFLSLDMNHRNVTVLTVPFRRASLPLSCWLPQTASISLCCRLSDVPPKSYEPYYAGWSRFTEPSPKSVTIHHRQGDVKKISFDDDKLLAVYQQQNPPVWLYEGSAPDAFWRVQRWDAGTTEPGSSGAPLFNPLKQIIGNLTGGEAVCALPENDYFSKFYKCWDYYPQKNRRLLEWLDPGLTGIMSVGGYDPYNPDQPIQFFERFLVYPNPNDGYFTIETDTLSLKGAFISLYNTDGRLMGMFRPPTARTANFNFSHLGSGVYILEVRIGDLMTRRKIIIAK